MWLSMALEQADSLNVFSEKKQATHSVWTGDLLKILGFLQKKGTKQIAWSLDFYGAGNEIRTRDVNLGKVALYH